jgi:hypothetical protein
VIARRVALGAILCAGVFWQTPASAEDCQTIKRDQAGYLELCNDQLRSFALQMSDQSWRIANGPRGKRWFVCRATTPLETRPSMMEVLNGAPDNPDMLCPGEPVVGFAFDWRSNWQGSKKDGLAIVEALMNSPIALGEPAITPSAISCEAFDVSAAGLPGRALCLKVGEASIVAAVFGDQNAFILAFSQKGTNVEALRDRVVATLLPKFAAEQFSADVRLLRWMR